MSHFSTLGVEEKKKWTLLGQRWDMIIQLVVGHQQIQTYYQKQDFAECNI